MLFFKKVILSYRNSSIADVLKRIKGFLRILIMLCIDIRDLYITSGRNYSDEEYVGYQIRKHAHMLEKLLKNLHEKFELSEMYGKNLYIHLQQFLSLWGKENYEKDEFISWAEKIADEYRKKLEYDTSCPMIGKQTRRKKVVDLLLLIKERRSIRTWSGEHLNSKQIEMLIDAAKWAPSSCNRQTSHFLIVDNKTLITNVSVTVRGGRFFFSNAAVLIIVLNDSRPYLLPEEKYIIYQDGAAAIENLLLMAHNLGLGACWGAYTSDTGIILGERKMRKLLNIPTHFKISGIIALGKPGEKVCKIPRRSNQSVVYYNKL